MRNRCRDALAEEPTSEVRLSLGRNYRVAKVLWMT
jgi:hypothetical protein